jgi:hypothetical protein
MFCRPEKYATFCEKMKALADSELSDEQFYPLLKIAVSYFQSK